MIAVGHLCGCFDCAHPTDANAALRVEHALAHDAFEEQWASEATDEQRGKWEAMRILYGFEHTADAVCLLPHHQPMPEHFVSSHRTAH